MPIVDCLHSYDDAAIEKLLDRSQLKDDSMAKASATEDKYLGALSFAKVWEHEPTATAPLTNNDPEYWPKLLAGRVKETREEVLGKGHRKRKNVECVLRNTKG